MDRWLALLLLEAEGAPQKVKPSAPFPPLRLRQGVGEDGGHRIDVKGASNGRNFLLYFSEAVFCEDAMEELDPSDSPSCPSSPFSVQCFALPLPDRRMELAKFLAENLFKLACTDACNDLKQVLRDLHSPTLSTQLRLIEMNDPQVPRPSHQPNHRPHYRYAD